MLRRIPRGASISRTPRRRITAFPGRAGRNRFRAPQVRPPSICATRVGRAPRKLQGEHPRARMGVLDRPTANPTSTPPPHRVLVRLSELADGGASASRPER